MKMEIKRIKCAVLFLLFTFVISACEYDELAKNETLVLISDIENERNVRCAGLEIPTCNGIKTFRLVFESNKNANLHTARIEYMHIAESVLQKINSNTKLRPLLHNYPMTFNEIDLSMAFNQDNDEPEATWGVIHFAKHDITYKAPLYGELQADTILTETYEEALAKMEEMKNSVAVKLPQE